jgi:hypothetical protein
MALEAGNQMHEIFATTRIWQLHHVDRLPKHAEVTGERIFGYSRWHDVLDNIGAHKKGGWGTREKLMDLCFGILDSAGWEDNPDDNVRTMENMQLATLAYIDASLPKMENWPIYVEDRSDPRSFLGIEQVFDVVITFGDGKEVRFIGTVDGLVHHIKFEDAPVLDENKTAARLSDGWRAKWELDHQITGYCLAGSVIFGFPIVRSRVQGVKIKPTGKGEDVYPVEPLVRTPEMFETWGKWCRYTVDMYEQYRDNFEDAPRFTHSCNRFFRPCALIPFCGDSVAGRVEQYGEMVPAHKSPSERAIEEA